MLESMGCSKTLEALEIEDANIFIQIVAQNSC